MGKFTVEEINFICVFGIKSKTELIKNIEKVFSYLQNSEMEELAKMVLKKLQDMPDEEFEQTDFNMAE